MSESIESSDKLASPQDVFHAVMKVRDFFATHAAKPYSYPPTDKEHPNNDGQTYTAVLGEPRDIGKTTAKYIQITKPDSWEDVTFSVRYQEGDKEAYDTGVAQEPAARIIVLRAESPSTYAFAGNGALDDAHDHPLPQEMLNELISDLETCD